MKRVAIYAGSFDPFTLGHLHVATIADRMFDKVIIAIGNNEKKATPFLTVQERLTLITTATAHLENVYLARFDGLLANYAKSACANYLIRGLRPLGDWESEYQMARANSLINPNLETVFILASKDTSEISSTLVREVYKFSEKGNEIENWVPDCVFEYLKEKKRAGKI